MKHKNTALRVKAAEIKADGTFTGYGSVFGTTDSYNEIVMPGAFTASLADWRTRGALPALLWQHDSRQPIGIYTSMAEDDYGLRVEGKLLIDTVEQAAEAFALLQAGALNGLSIGYDCTNWTVDEEKGAVELNVIDLWECSLVTFPANDEARVDGTKSDGKLPSLKEFERFLREVGHFSGSEAKAIAGKGLSYLLPREAGSKSTESTLADVLALIKSS
jgi:HK97 family phage prohead protease